MLSPEVRRELIRLANRDRRTVEDIESLLEYAQFTMEMNGLSQDDQTVVGSLFEIWKESFDEKEP